MRSNERMDGVPFEEKQLRACNISWNLWAEENVPIVAGKKDLKHQMKAVRRF